MVGRGVIRFGLSIPNFGAFADPRFVGEIAHAVEEAGWDGLYIWDHVAISNEFPIGDPWIALAAAAGATSRIRLGTMVTPLPRRRPWKVARETVALDILSGGRFMFGVGSGSDMGGEFSRFGETETLRERAGMLDESLEILELLWSGQAVTFRGRYHRVEHARFEPRPIQRPRIPIFVAGHWPHVLPLRRAARWDGYAPLVRLGDGSVRYLTPDEIGAAVDEIGRLRGSMEGFDLFAGGALPSSAATRDEVEAAAQAGATWWLGLIEVGRAVGSSTDDLLRLARHVPLGDAP